MSIFRKDCPRCGEASLASANACNCGFIFHADVGTYEAVELASQEQELYEAYLAARMEQARRAAELAIESLAADPGDEVKAAEADRANQVLEQLNIEYESQLGALDGARQNADEARRRAEAKQKHQLALAAESARKLAYEKRKAEALRQKGSDLLERPALTTQQVAQRVVADFEQLDPVVSSSPATYEVNRPWGGRGRFHATEAIRARRAAQALIAQKAAAISAKRTTSYAMPSQLKQDVSEKAEQVVQHARRSLQSINDNLTAAAQALGKSAAEMQNQHQFRVAQQDRLAARSQAGAGRDLKECPNCTAQTARASNACRCGYQFTSGGSEMPGLSLSTDDAAKLSEFI